MQVLVTGGAGFIGSHLVPRLLDDGHQVRVLDDLSAGQRENVPAGVELWVDTVEDPEVCRRACEGVQAVFHLAAYSRFSSAYEQLEQLTRVNVLGTQNVLLAARAASCQKLLYTGSSTYYGDNPLPQHEEQPPDLMNVYGLTKATGEHYTHLFDRLYGLPTLVMRLFNVYGPGQPTSGAYALVLGIFLRQAAAGQPLTLHGEGAQLRDFVHVSDVVEALLAGWRSPRHGRTYNVGSGTALSVKALADLISSNQQQVAARQGDSAGTLADLTRIEAELGWRPQVDFAQALDELLAPPGR